MVGLFSFFRHFIKNFSNFSGKLTVLTKKDAKWKGGVIPPEAEAAFQYLKTELLKQPTLGKPDASRTVYLHADARKDTVRISGTIGWATLQYDENSNCMPIGFGSRTLKENENKLAVNHLELFFIGNMNYPMKEIIPSKTDLPDKGSWGN